MSETTEPIAPGVYHDRDGDAWVILQDQYAVGLADHAAGPPTSSEFAVMALRPCAAEELAAEYGPLTPIHLFPEAQA